MQHEWKQVNIVDVTQKCTHPCSWFRAPWQPRNTRARPDDGQ